MALIERLMGLADDGSTQVGWPRKIPVHAFFAANHERIEGRLTRQQVIDMFAMDAATIVEYDTLTATAPTGSNALQTALKSLFIEKIHAVLILANAKIRYAGYTTPAEVRVKLGL